ncbi:MAG: large-conductance mechanosensitive channel protein MscL [Bacilli bacterium]|nr:large-conductance mechanosensitive channel protein MscL [Bacilli bacterium]
MIKEFKEFIHRGNVMDLAVGVIVGGAFSSIVTSLVNNILTPILGIFLGGVDFSGLTITIKDATISYGLFVQSVIDFLIVAFCIFLFVKMINKIMSVGKKETKEEPIVLKKKEEVLLLEEIRDLLKKKSPKKTKLKKQE